MQIPNFPHSKQAENTVIGTLLTFPDTVPLAVRELSADAFYQNDTKTIYEAITALFSAGKGIDMVSVFEAVKTKKNGFHINELINYTHGVLSPAHILTHIEIIKDKYVKRQLIINANKVLVQAAADELPAEEIIGSHTQALYGIQQHQQKELSLTDLIVQQVTERETRNGLRGYATGYSELDRIIKGFNPTDLNIIAGRPGQGKTAFALNLFYNIAKNGVACDFISLEMSLSQLMERIESIVSGVENTKLQANTLTDAERRQLMAAHEHIAKLPITLTDMPRCDINRIRARVAMQLARHGTKVFFVDYLQLIKGGKRDRYEDITEVSINLKSIAKEFGVCMVVLAQLSREVEKRADKIPQLSDLKESGQIEQDADRVIFLMRPEYYGIPAMEVGGVEQPTANRLLLRIAKNRHGEAAKTVLLQWNGSNYQIKNLEKEIFKF